MEKKVKDRLGGGDEDGQDEISELQSRLKALHLPEEAQKIADQELKKLRNLGPRN